MNTICNLINKPMRVTLEALFYEYFENHKDSTTSKYKMGKALNIKYPKNSSTDVLVMANVDFILTKNNYMFLVELDEYAHSNHPLKYVLNNKKYSFTETLYRQAQVQTQLRKCYNEKYFYVWVRLNGHYTILQHKTQNYLINENIKKKFDIMMHLLDQISLVKIDVDVDTEYLNQNYVLSTYLFYGDNMVFAKYRYNDYKSNLNYVSISKGIFDYDFISIDEINTTRENCRYIGEKIESMKQNFITINCSSWLKKMALEIITSPKFVQLVNILKKFKNDHTIKSLSHTILSDNNKKKKYSATYECIGVKTQSITKITCDVGNINKTLIKNIDLADNINDETKEYVNPDVFMNDVILRLTNHCNLISYDYVSKNPIILFSALNTKELENKYSIMTVDTLIHNRKKILAKIIGSKDTKSLYKSVYLNYHDNNDANKRYLYYSNEGRLDLRTSNECAIMYPTRNDKHIMNISLNVEKNKINNFDSDCINKTSNESFVSNIGLIEKNPNLIMYYVHMLVEELKITITDNVILKKLTDKINIYLKNKMIKQFDKLKLTPSEKVIYYKNLDKIHYIAATRYPELINYIKDFYDLGKLIDNIKSKQTGGLQSNCVSISDNKRYIDNIINYQHSTDTLIDLYVSDFILLTFILNYLKKNDDTNISNNYLLNIRILSIINNELNIITNLMNYRINSTQKMYLYKVLKCLKKRHDLEINDYLNNNESKLYNIYNNPFNRVRLHLSKLIDDDEILDTNLVFGTNKYVRLWHSIPLKTHVPITEIQEANVIFQKLMKIKISKSNYKDNGLSGINNDTRESKLYLWYDVSLDYEDILNYFKGTSEQAVPLDIKDLHKLVMLVTYLIKKNIIKDKLAGVSDSSNVNEFIEYGKKFFEKFVFRFGDMICKIVNGILIFDEIKNTNESKIPVNNTKKRKERDEDIDNEEYNNQKHKKSKIETYADEYSRDIKKIDRMQIGGAVKFIEEFIDKCMRGISTPLQNLVEFLCILSKNIINCTISNKKFYTEKIINYKYYSGDGVNLLDYIDDTYQNFVNLVNSYLEYNYIIEVIQNDKIDTINILIFTAINKSINDPYLKNIINILTESRINNNLKFENTNNIIIPTSVTAH